MNMKNKVILIIISLFLSQMGMSQSWRYSRHEVQFGLGASNFLGDLGGGSGIGTHGIKDFEFRSTRPTLMLGYKYMVTPTISVKGSIITSYLSGDDALTTEFARNNRNLSFRSGLLELGASVEFYPWTERTSTKFKVRGAKGNRKNSLSPYFVVGVGFAMFNPKTQFNGSWVSLQPLGTEGQGLAGRPEKYKRYTMSFPVGIGVKYLLNRSWSVGFEMSLRYTLSDYIDDVSGSYYLPSEIEKANGSTAAILSDRSLNPSLGITGVLSSSNGTNNYLQRGNPNYNDAYSFAIFSVHYRLIKGAKFIPKF